MIIDAQSRRRMVINKFSNRPPFDLKNKEISVTRSTEIRKASLESVNKSYKGIIKHLDATQPRESQSENNTKNIIPKIIESFQKVTPTRQVVFLKNKKNHLSSKDSSLQTIYRNHFNFGKHIPKHQIMKNLLQDFESETNMKNKNSYHGVDTIPTRETCPRTHVKSLRKKVDKTTSTSGLAWPVVLKSGERIPIRITQSTPVKSRSRIPKRKDVNKKTAQMEASEVESKPTSRYSSDAEYIPIKEKLPFSGIEKGAIGDQTPNHHSYIRENTYILQENTDEEKSGRKKEKSFVQNQVDKFNKISSMYAPRRKQAARNREWENMNRNMNKNYLSMMTSVKKHYPRMQEIRTEPTTTDNYDWSDTADNTTDVKFPKETRDAMESLILSTRKFTRTPLSKYLKHSDMELQPAIPEYSIEHCKNAHSHETFKHHIPCSKSLLCHRGEHEGPCANMQRVPFCRPKKRRAKVLMR
ncbi:hypothetical protein JTB14_004052 [Gonioctena quinquepunctata]|nr:hypothetical protein JTB14_004052 [Gonioctena quinquepunctata]